MNETFNNTNIATNTNNNTLQTGYRYRDVIREPIVRDLNSATLATFATQLSVQFAVRDFRYLSNANITTINITDPDQMNGITPVTFEINFNDLLEQDSSGVTKFVVGGRAYFECLVYGANTVTFPFRGFFDELGY